MKLRRVRVEGGSEVQDLDQDGRWQPPPDSMTSATRDALRELPGRVGGTWRIEIAGPAGPHHPIRVAIMSRLPLTGPRQTPPSGPACTRSRPRMTGTPERRTCPPTC